MAVTNDKRGFPGIAASAVGEGMAVAHASGGAAFGVHPATMLAGARLAGLAEATSPSAGMAVNVINGGVAKGWAAASIANGDLVTAGSINGALVPFVASPATAGNPMRFYLGRSLQNAGPGERFSVLVDPGSSL
jgi:hypothetical protein